MAAIFASATARALPLGMDITISDRNNNGSNPVIPSNWYSDREDNETETNPNTINAQVWDLEGMYLNGSKLTLLGGFDFKNGTHYDGYVWKGGDIFIDIGGNGAIYGQTANGGSGTTQYSNIQPIATSNLFGYDYVLDIGAFFGNTFAFNIVQLTPGNTLLTRAADVAASNPWTYQSGGTVMGGGVGDYGLLAASDFPSGGLLGYGSNNNHFYMTVDLASVPGIAGTDIFHYTIECGNDDLMGRAQIPAQSPPPHVPDMGSTALLFSITFLGIEAFRRKFRA